MPKNGVIVERRFEPDEQAQLWALRLLLNAPGGSKPIEKGTARLQPER
jgi:hypothetical protein